MYVKKKHKAMKRIKDKFINVKILYMPIKKFDSPLGYPWRRPLQNNIIKYTKAIFTNKLKHLKIYCKHAT